MDNRDCAYMTPNSSSSSSTASDSSSTADDSSSGSSASGREGAAPAAAPAGPDERRVRRFAPFSDGLKNCLGQVGLQGAMRGWGQHLIHTPYTAKEK